MRVFTLISTSPSKLGREIVQCEYFVYYIELNRRGKNGKGGKRGKRKRKRKEREEQKRKESEWVSSFVCFTFLGFALLCFYLTLLCFTYR